MHRFFLDVSNKTDVGDLIEITGEDHQHISKALRMKQGENLVACSENETEYLCEVFEISRNLTIAKVIGIQQNQSEMKVKTVLYQGLPKGQKMETIIQKCVELGIDEIVPIVTMRTVVKLTDSNKKVVRWNKISLEASKQSGRGKVPLVREPLDLKDALALLKNNTVNIVAFEKEIKSLKNVFSDCSKPEKIGIIIGPEGGFDEAEIEMLKDRGVISISLGKRILRTETAGMALLSMIVYQYEL